MTEASPVNPYFFGGPVKDPRGFFGRGEQLQIIFDNLLKAGSTSVIGQRRSGKTSLLFYLATDAAHEAFSFDARSLVFVYVDPQLGMHGPGEFYRRLMDLLAKQAPEAMLSPGGETNEERLQAVLERLKPRRLVLLLDEFEKIIDTEGFPADFFTFLRGISQSYDVCFVTTTMKSLYECSSREFAGSPLFNIFQMVWLGSFTQEEFEHFIRETSKRCGAPMATYKGEIEALAGRFPFYVQLACSLYFEAWRGHQRITPQDHIAIRQRFADETRPHFERMWKTYLNAAEKAALVSLAHGRPCPDRPALHSLDQKGYVVDERIFSSALTDFLLYKEREGETLVPDTSMRPAGPTPKGIWVDKDKGDVWVDGERVAPLTRLEYKLLVYLYDNANCICDKYGIVEAVWSSDYIDDVDDPRIAKLVSRLREDVEPNPKKSRYIITVHGRGYKLADENA